MQLDSFTILVANAVALVFLGAALLYFWLRDRRSAWLLWWAAPLIIAGGAMSWFTQPNWSTDFAAITYGNLMRIVAVACFWQGARVFDGRRPTFAPVAAMGIVWVALCLYPPFLASLPGRIIAVSLANGGACLLAAWELWRGRAEHLPSRLPTIAVLFSFGIFLLGRIPAIDLAPFPYGALPLDRAWLNAFNLLVFAHGLALGLLLIALTKERRELEQRRAALVDPLTGLLNRRAFMAHVEHAAMGRGPAPDEPTALLVLDLDHFKRVNDRFGHEAGDRALAAFGEIASNSVRPTDLLYRMGGEEFCFVLPDTDLDAAVAIAERVREAVAASRHVVAGGQAVPVTVSIGIAVAEQGGIDLQVLHAAADAALYEAKSHGRNQVVVAEPSLLGRRAAAGRNIRRFRAAG